MEQTNRHTAQIVFSLWWGAIFVSGISSRMHMNCTLRCYSSVSHERTPSLRIAGSFSSSLVQDRSRDTEGRRRFSFWRNTRFSPRVHPLNFRLLFHRRFSPNYRKHFRRSYRELISSFPSNPPVELLEPLSEDNEEKEWKIDQEFI